MEEYAKKHKLEVIRRFDIVESSTRGDRPEFNKMIEFVESYKQPIALICDKVDRLQRSFFEFPVLDKLRRSGRLVLHFLDIGKLDENSSSQQITMYQMSVVMANAYTNAISDNVKRSITHKISNGECMRKAPLGYLNVEENGKKTVIVDKLRAPLIKKMFQMYSLGNTSTGDLQKFAAENGLTNNFFSEFETKTITKNVISCLLKNPFYYGEIYIKKHNRLYPHKYDRLISKHLFDECQKVNEDRCKTNNRIQAVQTAKAGKDFIFKSLVKCGTTGRVVTCDRKEKGRIKTSTYLMCWDPDNIKKKIWVNENEVLEKIEQVFKSMVIPKDMLESVRKHLQNLHDEEKDFYKSRIDDLNRRLALAHTKYDRLVDMNLEGSITGDIFAKKDREIKEEIANLKTDIAMNDIADEKFKTLVITVMEFATEAHELFLYANVSEKRSLIDFVFSDITLTGKTLEYTLRKPFDLMVDLASCSAWLPVLETLRTNYVGLVIGYHEKLDQIKCIAKNLSINVC